MFHILVQACLTEKQLKFSFNRKTVVFVLCLTLQSFNRHCLTPQASIDDFFRPQKCETFGRVGMFSADEIPRPALSQFWSLNIRRSANFMEFRNVVRRILKFQNYERVGRDSTLFFMPSSKICFDKNIFDRS